MKGDDDHEFTTATAEAAKQPAQCQVEEVEQEEGEKMGIVETSRIPPLEEDNSQDDQDFILKVVAARAHYAVASSCTEQEEVQETAATVDGSSQQQQQQDETLKGKVSGAAVAGASNDNTTCNKPGAYMGSPGEAMRRTEDPRFSLVGMEDTSCSTVIMDGSTSTTVIIQQREDDETSPTNSSAVAPPPSAATVIASNRVMFDLSLVEANPVSEDDEIDHDSLSTATPIDLEETRERQRKWKRQRIMFVGCLASVVVAGVIIIGSVVGTTLRDSRSPAAQEPIPPATTNYPALTPSSSPTSAWDLLWEELPASTLSKIYTPGTPQERSYTWLVTHKNISCLSTWRMKQLFALSTFYYAFEGEQWLGGTRVDWLDQNKHECDWFSGEYGSFCDAEEGYEENSFFVDDTCNHKREFQILNLGCLELGDLSPFIPPEIALLSSLSTIYLANNNIQVPFANMIPSELSQLQNLTEMNFESNSLHGPIPTQLGRVSSLEVLSLMNNPLTGLIPSELGMIISLQSLRFWNNQLTGPIPSQLGLLSNLEWLMLHNNSLSGPIPSELGQLSSLEMLVLSHNSLSGIIPTELGLLCSTLKYLVLSDNPLLLSDSIPTELNGIRVVT